jgi:signal transduction histidine kinase
MILIVAMTLVFFNISQLPLSFVPINEEREEAAVEWDPDSSQYQTSLLLSTIITIPMIYDLFLDGCAYRLPIFMDVVVGLSRILLVLALTLPNLWVFYLSDDVQKGSHIIASIVFQMASHGCVCVFLSVYNPKTYAGPICLSAVIFNAIGAELHIRQRLPGVGLFFYAVAYCHFLYLFAAWASDWIKTGRKMEASDLVNLTCFISLSILSTGSFAIEIIYKGSFTSVSAASMNYVHLVFTVVLMALPNQIAKFNVRIMLRKTEEKEAFIRYISHEIRTPLNTVFLGMNFIKDELDAIAPLVLENVEVMLDTLNEVSNCCEVAISIVNDLLTFDKLEEGKMTLDLKETDIESYLTQTLKPFDIQARGKDIAISFVVEDSKDNWGSSNVLWLDQSKMGQVIRNLVSNAVKFTPARGTVCVSTSQIKVQVPDARRNKSSSSVPSFPQIAVREPLRTLGRKIAPLISGKHSLLDQKYSRQSTTLDGSSPQSVPHINYLRIEVRDSGAGISEENQKKLFGQYVQFNAGKLQQGNGSGLGLWISKGITELHGGTSLNFHAICCIHLVPLKVKLVPFYFILFFFNFLFRRITVTTSINSSSDSDYST